MAGRGDHGLRHVIECALRRSPGGGRQGGGAVRRSAGVGQQLRRRARQDDLAPEPGDRRGGRGHGRQGGRHLQAGVVLERCPYAGHVRDRVPVDCRYTITHMTSVRATLQNNTRLKMSPSLPAMPTAAAAIARFWGEIILPSTPPELLADASRTSDSPASLAASTWRAPKSAFDDVSEPVIATPSHPTIADRKANTSPEPATQRPSVVVMAVRFIT